MTDMTPEQALIKDLRDSLKNATAKAECCGHRTDDAIDGAVCCGSFDVDWPEDVAELLARADKALSRPAAPEVTDDDLRALWYAHGGVIEGLHVEKGVMLERDLLLFLRALRTVDAPAVPEGAEVWVLYDARADRKYIKKNVGDGCLAVFDYEHEAIDASGRHPGTAYKKMRLVAPTAEESSGDHFPDVTKMMGSVTIPRGMYDRLIELLKADEKSWGHQPLRVAREIALADLQSAEGDSE